MVQQYLPAAFVLISLCLLPVAEAIVIDPNFTDVTLECDPTGVLLTVNSSALAEAFPGMEAETVRVGEGPWLDHCRPRENMDGPRGIKSFKFNYGDCHPRVEELSETKMRLTYDITGNMPEREEGSLTPEGASVSCLVPRDGLIGARMEADTNLYEYVGSKEGPFQFGMTIYKDSFMTVPVSQNEEIPLGVPLWVGMKLNTTTSHEMFVRDCWATPNPTNSEDQPGHIFIKNGLIGEDDETFSPSDDSITSSTYGFSFDSFMFRGEGTHVYIKCHVHVCDPYDTDASDQTGCNIPKYPEFHVSARDIQLMSGSGMGSGFGINTRDVGEQETKNIDENIDETVDENVEDEAELEEDKRELGETEEDVNGVENVDTRDVVTERPVYYIMNAFKVKHTERKRRSAGSYRVYPRQTMFTNLRSGIMLGIIIVSTAMFSACAILLPLHLSGEKVRCLHVKPAKRTV